MDRDVSQALLNVANGMKTALQSIVTNLYGARITTQPIDTEGAVEDTVTFSIVAENAVSYQWYYRTSPTSLIWHGIPSPTYTKDTLSVTVTSDVYQYRYKCEVTGKDGKKIFSDTVKVLQPKET